MGMTENDVYCNRRLRLNKIKGNRMESRLEKLEKDNLWEKLHNVILRLKEMDEIEIVKMEHPTITIKHTKRIREVN